MLVYGNENQKLLLDAITIMLEYRVPCPVPRPIRSLFADRRRGRCPVHTAFLIPDIQRLGRLIHRGVIRPLRQAIALAVAIPGKTGPCFAEHRSEGWVGDDVYPRRRRMGVGTEINHVFTSVPGKPTQSIKVG